MCISDAFHFTELQLGFAFGNTGFLRLDAGQSRSRHSWIQSESQIWMQQSIDAQSGAGELQMDGSTLMVIRNIYRLVTAEMAPKFLGLIEEVSIHAFACEPSCI